MKIEDRSDKEERKKEGSLAGVAGTAEAPGCKTTAAGMSQD